MIGYYYLNYYCDEIGEETLFLPYNLIARDTKRGLEVELDPTTIQTKSLVLLRTNTIKKGFLEKLNVPDTVVRRLRNSCFSGDIETAREIARNLFYWAQQEVKKKFGDGETARR